MIALRIMLAGRPAEHHGAEADRRNLQARAAELAIVHGDHLPATIRDPARGFGAGPEPATQAGAAPGTTGARRGPRPATARKCLSFACQGFATLEPGRQDEYRNPRPEPDAGHAAPGDVARRPRSRPDGRPRRNCCSASTATAGRSRSKSATSGLALDPGRSSGRPPGGAAAGRDLAAPEVRGRRRRRASLCAPRCVEVAAACSSRRSLPDQPQADPAAYRGSSVPRASRCRQAGSASTGRSGEERNLAGGGTASASGTPRRGVTVSAEGQIATASGRHPRARRGQRHPGRSTIFLQAAQPPAPASAAAAEEAASRRAPPPGPMLGQGDGGAGQPRPADGQSARPVRRGSAGVHLCPRRCCRVRTRLLAQASAAGAAGADRRDAEGGGAALRPVLRGAIRREGQQRSHRRRI